MRNKRITPTKRVGTILLACATALTMVPGSVSAIAAEAPGSEAVENAGVESSTQARLLVESPDKDSIDESHVIASYEDTYLLGYDSAEDADAAFAGLSSSSAAAAYDETVISIAGNSADGAALEAMTESSNPLTQLGKALESEAKASDDAQVVALIDTGVSKNNAVIESVSMLGDDASDANGHGTQEAEAILSESPDAQIISIKALDENGIGSASTIYAAVEYAIARDVDVIDLQIAGCTNPVVSDVLVEAQEAGIEVIDAQVAAETEPAATTDEAVSEQEAAAPADIQVEEKSMVGADAAVTKKDVKQAETDALAEAYIRDNIDERYATVNKMELANILRVKQTLFDGSKVKSNETIDSIMGAMEQGDVDQMRKILGQLEGVAAVYDVDANSKYYVSFANTMQDDKNALTQDWIFAVNNDNGEELTDCIFDSKTGLAYIPKEDFDGTLKNVQVQFMQVFKTEVSEASSEAEVVTDASKIEHTTVTDEFLDIETELETEAGLNEQDLTVTVNGIPLAEEFYKYESETGRLKVALPPATVQSVSVTDETDSAKEQFKKAFAPTVANAANPDTMGYYVYDYDYDYQGAGGVPSDDHVTDDYSNDPLILPSWVTTNTWFQGTTYFQYQTGGKYNDRIYVYKNHNLYGYDPDYSSSIQNLQNDLWNQNVDWGDLQTIDYNDGQFTGRIWLGYNVSDGREMDMYQSDNSSLHDLNEIFSSQSGKSGNYWFVTQCSHADTPVDGKGKEGTLQNGAVRMPTYLTFLKVDRTKNYAVIGIVTANYAGQSQVGVYKLPIKPSNGYVAIQKKSGNTAISNANTSAYSLAGAKYGVYSGSSLVTTLTTNASGYAKSGELAAGSYTIKEISAPANFNIDTKPYNVTVSPNATASVTSTDMPKPGWIEIQKASGNKAISDSSSAYSLAGAQYGIYSGSTLKATLTTNASGYAKSGDLPVGTYSVKEIKAPANFDIDTKPYNVTVTGGGTAKVASTDNPHFGYIEINKVSTDTKVTNGNDEYSLAGAKYAVKDSTGKTVTTLTTDAKGYAKSGQLAIGNYTVTETEASKGYEVDATPYEVTVTNNTTQKVDSNEQPQFGTFHLSKVANNEKLPFGDNACYTLKGAEYKVTAAEDIGEMYKKGEEVAIIKTDKNGQAYLNNIPYGTYNVVETKAPKNMGLDTTEHVIHLSEDNPDQTFTSDEPAEVDPITIEKQIDKDTSGDFDNDELKTIEGTEFTIKYYDIDPSDTLFGDARMLTQFTPKRTWTIKALYDGEGKCIATLDAEHFVSGDEFYTNEDGMIGMPIGYYTVEESKPMTGYTYDGEWIYTLNSNEEIVRYLVDEPDTQRESQIVMGKITQTQANHAEVTNTLAGSGITVVDIPLQIGTTATDNETGDHYALARENAEITDLVRYRGVLVGEEYTLKTVLMDRTTREVVPLIIDEEGTTADFQETAFVPEVANGTFPINLKFDASKLDGHDVVVYEYLIDSEGTEQARHEDINDERQTIHFPKIGTTVTDEQTTTNVSRADEEITLVDTVAYENVEVGREYMMSGVLYDETTGEEIIGVDGNPITAQTAFVPEETSGTVDVTFVFDGSILENTCIVVGETLETTTNTVAIHVDMTDHPQTIYVPWVGTKVINTANNATIMAPAEEMDLVDTVSYKNLSTEHSYYVVGILMKKTIGEPVIDEETGEEIETVEEEPYVDADGNYVMSHMVFTPGEVTEDPAAEGETGDDAIVDGEGDDVAVADDTETPAEGQEDAVTEGSEEAGEDAAAEGEEETKIDPSTVDEFSMDGEVDLSFVFNGTNLEQGDTLVVYEKVYFLPDGVEAPEFPNYFNVPVDETDNAGEVTDETGETGDDVAVDEPGEGEEEPAAEDTNALTEDLLVGVHEDINDIGQTVTVPDIHTSLVDSETGLHNTIVADTITLTDTVTYENLQPGLEYVITGQLYNKDSGQAAVDAAGSEIFGQTTFIPEEASGTVEVEFKFVGTGLVNTSYVAFEELFYDDVSYAVHADIDDEAQTVRIPDIGTTAVDDATGDHITFAGEEASITDTVEFKNLIPGEEYVVSGKLMDKATGEVLKSGDKEVVGETTFTPETEDGTVDVVFTFDASELDGITTVAFENISLEGTVVATHEDIEDEGQTIHIPKLGTTAEINGGKTAEEADEMKLVDTLAYENLIPDIEYTVKGKVYDKTAGELTDITAEGKFTPTEANGKASLTFTFNGHKYAGHELVVYEYMYYKDTDNLVAQHEDKDDAAQTVSIKKAPSANSNNGSPTTGDVISWGGICGAILAGVLIAIAAVRRRKQNA